MRGVKELRDSERLPRTRDRAVSSEARRVYACLVRHPDGLGNAEAARLTGLDEAEVDRAAAHLRTLGLLEAGERDASTLRAVAPDSARTKVLGPIVRELERKQGQVDELRDAYTDLMGVYNDSALHRSTVKSVEILHDPATVRAVIAELAAGARSEIVASQPGGAGQADVLRDALGRTDPSFARGVRMRVLYQHTARYGPATVDFVDHITQLGAEVRTSSDGFMRLAVFDEEVALIGLRDDPSGAVVVRDPHVVHFTVSAFERAWAQAEVFKSGYDPEELRWVANDIKTTIMYLLVDGVGDKIIARRLGMSLRTLQRHIAEIMAQIGAKNRLHAGYLIHQYGLASRF